MNKQTYTIIIKYFDGETETVVIETHNIADSMEQFIRNRKPLTWEIESIKV